MSPEVIYILSDNIIEVTGVTNVASGVALNNAVVTVTLLDSATGVAVAGQTWPLQLSYIAASSGNYRGTLIDGLALSENQYLFAEVTVDGGDGLKRYWKHPCVARVGD